jgi:hypothetical protein
MIELPHLRARVPSWALAPADWEMDVATGRCGATLHKLFFRLEAVHLGSSLVNISCGKGILMLMEVLRMGLNRPCHVEILGTGEVSSTCIALIFLAGERAHVQGVKARKLTTSAHRQIFKMINERTVLAIQALHQVWRRPLSKEGFRRQLVRLLCRHFWAKGLQFRIDLCK